jgi:oligopeptidase B
MGFGTHFNGHTPPGFGRTITRGAAVGSAGGSKLHAPLADRESVEHVIHNDRRVDHYAWMKNKKDPRVRAYLDAENAYSNADMHGTDTLQESLYQEMLGRIQQTDLTVPYRLRGYEYYSRTEEGKQYPIYCRKRILDSSSVQRNEPNDTSAHSRWGNDTVLQELRDELRHEFGEEAFECRTAIEPAPEGMREESAAPATKPVVPGQEEILLDLNEMAVGHTFMALAIFEVSDDDQFLAFATDTTGYRQYLLQVKDLRNHSPLPLRVERVTSAAWAMDNRTLFYVTEDDVTKRSNQLWRHVFPDQPSDPSYSHVSDDLLYEEKDERFRMDIERSRSSAYLFLVINSHTTSEVRYLRADFPFTAFQLVEPRTDDHEYYLDHHPGSSSDPAGGVFFIRTNSGGRTYRLVSTPTHDPGRARWHEVIPNRRDVMLAGLEAFRTHLVLTEREDGLPHLRIVDLMLEAPTALDASIRLSFSEPAYNANFGNNPEFDQETLRFQYESMVTPRSVYDYELSTTQWILKKRQPVLGDFDTANYVSERLHAKAADGTLIPISLVRHKNSPRDASAPLLLYGYGSYGLSMPIAFSSNRLSLLDRGFIYAIAHIRGGGELGKPWHDAGRMRRKMNTFTDFISSAEFLVAKRYTSHHLLVIEGGSAGGLLMGAVANMAPEKFQVVVSHVPFVDVLNTMLDPSLPLTVGEYEEWGNPELADDYFYMKQYCPYTNVDQKSYPSMLVKTAWNDSQVMYWEAAKYVAKLRSMKTDSNTLLLKTNMGAGHGGASGRYDFLREVAFDYAFILRELNLHP